MILFHGSNMKVDKIDLNKSKNNRDFGVGFYTTTDLNQSRRWAESVTRRKRKGKPHVMRYYLPNTEGLKRKKFKGVNKSWLQFIIKNRQKGGIQHNYDIVEGPVADAQVYNIISAYQEGIYTMDEALKRLKTWQNTDQISFHSERALRRLQEQGWET